MRDDRERLLDILEAIARIERYTDRGRATFESDELIQNWVLSHLQIIGEACRSMSPSLRDAHPEVPWNQIIGMRHVLGHQYFDVDVNIVWSVVENDLCPLRAQVQALLRVV